jgi:hypothetical protein
VAEAGKPPVGYTPHNSLPSGVMKKLLLLIALVVLATLATRKMRSV